MRAFEQLKQMAANDAALRKQAGIVEDLTAATGMSDGERAHHLRTLMALAAPVGLGAAIGATPKGSGALTGALRGLGATTGAGIGGSLGTLAGAAGGAGIGELLANDGMFSKDYDTRGLATSLGALLGGSLGTVGGGFGGYGLAKAITGKTDKEKEYARKEKAEKEQEKTASVNHATVSAWHKLLKQAFPAQ